MSLPNQNTTYTYADYITWPDEEKVEIINGIPYLHAAPSWQHQAISLELSRQFANFLSGKPCQVFASPFDVCLAENGEQDEKISTVVQPDISIICDSSKLRKTGFFGVPTLIIEITSPSTFRNDRLYKFNLYEKFKVKEYWIVEPEQKLVSVFTLQENGRFGRPEIYTESDKIRVACFPELEIDIGLVFEKC